MSFAPPLPNFGGLFGDLTAKYFCLVSPVLLFPLLVMVGWHMQSGMSSGQSDTHWHFWFVLLGFLLWLRFDVIVLLMIHDKRNHDDIIIKFRILPHFSAQFFLDHRITTQLGSGSQNLWQHHCCCPFADPMLSHANSITLILPNNGRKCTGWSIPFNHVWIRYNISIILHDDQQSKPLILPLTVPLC